MNKGMSRRSFLMLSAGAMAGAALVACQAPVAPGAGSGAAVPAAESVELTMWGWTDLIWEHIMEQFEEQHPGVTVNLTELGDIVFGDQKFLTAVAADTGPDVAIQNRHTFLQFAAKGLYSDVTPKFDASSLNRDDFTPVQLAESSWEGNIYGLPLNTDVRYLYWNTDAFEEVGLDPTKPPTTWEELGDYTEKLNLKDSNDNFERMGFVPYLFGNSWMWLYGFLNKAPAISDDKRTILCDDERWIYTMDWMVDFYDQYIGDFELANAYSEAATSAGLGEPFVAGKVAMVADGDWTVGSLLRSPSFEWDTAPMPIPPGGEQSTWSCGFSLVMPPSVKSPDEAWELMRWTSGVEGWDARAEATLADTQRVWEREQIDGEPQYWPTQACYIPALQMLEEKYVTKLGEREQKAWALGIDALENWTHGCGSEMGVAALEYWVEMDNAARTALSHKMSGEQAMVEAQKKVQEATDRAWEGIDSA